MFLYFFWAFLLIAFIFLYLTYYGIFNPIIIHSIEYGPIPFFFKQYTGNYRQVGQLFEKIRRTAYRFFHEVQIMGIYYDDPSEIIDVYESRAVLGFIAETSDNDLLYNFKEKNGFGMDFKELPFCEALHVRFPYKSFLSFYVMGFKVYPKMYEYLKRRNLETHAGIIEEYHFKSGFVDIILPYGQKAKEFGLHSSTRPKYKYDKKGD